jgi:hypothetical protein
MSVTLLVALGVVVVSALVAAPMLFGRRPEPATVPVVSSTHRPPNRADSQHMPHAMAYDGEDVLPPWWQRLRSAFGLLFVTIAIAAMVAFVVGAVVLATGVALQ